MDRDNYNYTALHYAARAGDLEICELLLIEGRAEVNAVTKGGATPLHRASSMGIFFFFDDLFIWIISHQYNQCYFVAVVLVVVFLL